MDRDDLGEPHLMLRIFRRTQCEIPPQPRLSPLLLKAHYSGLLQVGQSPRTHDGTRTNDTPILTTIRNHH